MEKPTKKVVLLDFWAPWCGPCKLMEPLLDEIEREFTGKVDIRKYNVDEPQNQPLLERYQIAAMPTYIIEVGGEIAQQYVGAQSKKTLVEALNTAFDNS